MKYIIYGINRVSKDFIYMCPELDIYAFSDKNYTIEEYCGVPVLEFKELCKIKTFSFRIIICGFDKEDKEKELKKMGLKYKEDYYFADDFFYKLDSTTDTINPNNKKVIIWGTGRIATYFSDCFTYYKPEFYVDTYKSINRFFDIDVLDPNSIVDLKEFFIIIAVNDDADIVHYLVNKGLMENVDFVNAMIIMERASEMLRATIYDRRWYQLRCLTPLNHIELLTNGDVYCCCSTFMRRLGNVNNRDVKSLWNSTLHKIICLSVVNQTYTFCKKNMCPLFFGRNNSVLNTDDFYKDIYKKMEKKPVVGVIGFDYTCNLKCETCRNEIRIARDNEKAKMYEFAQITINDIIPDIKFFVMAGDGEVFASDAYKKIYRSSKLNHTPAIRILSNGTLFNKKTWIDFKGEKKGKILLTVSIDAASKEIYESIRRNGNFEKLKNNMNYASKLRKTGELAYLRMNFVVQKKNYKEIKEFIKWGMNLGVDEVFFTKILNWGTFSDDEFKEVSMFEHDGITPKKELKEILDDPMLKNEIVDLGTMLYAHDTSKYINIYNYYMWELERKVADLFNEL